MTNPDGNPAAERPYDAQTLAELDEMFGRERFALMLAGLDEEIVRRFDEPAAERDALGRDAHALVSVCGTLGFMPLSSACTDLERACLDGAETDAPLRRVLGEADAARRAIADLRAEMA